MRILYNNLWDLYTLTESQEDANYPVENTQDVRLAKVWRTENATSATIVIDVGTGNTITADSCAILNHNFSASSITVLRGNPTDSWGTATSMVTIVTYRTGIMVIYFPSATFRFWRLGFSDATNPDGYYEIGRVMLGEYLQVDPSSLVEFPEKHVRNDRQAFSKSNQFYADQGSGWKELKYKFVNTNDTMKGKMETMWNLNGKHTPLLLMNYDTSFSILPPLYCAIIKDITFGHLLHDKWDYNFDLRECD